jgi:hypothetical protein
MDELGQAIKEADVVSFELIDVLLVRGVCRPADVFRVTQEWFNAHSGRYLSDELAPSRLDAEAALRSGTGPADGPPAPLTLEAVYERVAGQMVLDPATTRLLVQAELEAERHLLRPVPELIELCRFALDQGKSVVVLADTVLSRQFVAGVLADHGVTGLADLVLSSDTAVPVGEDRTWADLARRFAGRPMLHVGTDGAMTRAAEHHGLATHTVTTATEAYRRQIGPARALDGPLVFRHLEIDGFRLKNVHRSMLNALAASTLAGHGELATPYVVGYVAAGPFMTAVAQWVHRAAGQRRCDRLHFSGPGAAFTAEAYRGWWGAASLPTTEGGAAAGSSGTAIVDSGWDGSTRRWDGGGPAGAPLADAPRGGPVAQLHLLIEPAGPVVEAQPELGPSAEVFVDGRIAGLRSLFEDLFRTSGATLELCFGAGASESPSAASAAVAGAVRRGALEYVADFKRATEGLPDTVAIVDRRTACENLAMAVRVPI